MSATPATRTPATPGPATPTPATTAGASPRVAGAGDGPALVLGLLAAALATGLGAAFGWRQGILLVVGLGLGCCLYHAAFGFTSAFRVLISDRRTAGLRAQMVMLALGCLLFFPALAAGGVAGVPLAPSTGPVGVSLLVGAFLFGLGMQLGGSCASGTLYAVGGGSGRTLVTLTAFIAGSLAGSAHLGWWARLPALPATTLATPGHWRAGLGASLALFLLIGAGAAWLERREHGALLPILRCRGDARPAAVRLLRGPWPLVWGGVGLALLNFAVLLLAGKPWGITSAFALWGAKLALLAGVDVASWPYWAQHRAALESPVLADATTVTNVGIVVGALVASLLAGRFRFVWRVPLPSLVAAVAGGLLLGYGARLAYGCNIGAYFSGVVSGSPHGWVWLAAALAGNLLGVRLRPAFGLLVERGPRRAGDATAG